MGYRNFASLINIEVRTWFCLFSFRRPPPHIHNRRPIKELKRILAYISKTNAAMDKWRLQLDSAH